MLNKFEKPKSFLLGSFCNETFTGINAIRGFMLQTHDKICSCLISTCNVIVSCMERKKKAAQKINHLQDTDTM